MWFSDPARPSGRFPGGAGPRGSSPWVPLALLCLASVPLACGSLPAVQHRTGGVGIGTGDGNRSMIFVAPTAEGPVLFDLGWTGAREALTRELEARGRRPSDVAAVFLTHAHRDHIAAWSVVAAAPFHLAVEDVPLLTGQAPPPGPLDRFFSRLVPANRPEPGELDLRPFTRDTALAFGADTVRAFHVPGHTHGSAAYLFRGVLFVGDAAGWNPFGGLSSPSRAYSYDAAAGHRNLRWLLRRADRLGARYVCTAHARCVPLSTAIEAI